MITSTSLRAAPLHMVRKADGLSIELDPIQGIWSEEQYLRLTDSSNLLVEFTDGNIEVLPMPTDNHQAISQFILLALIAFLQPFGGKVHYAPLRLQIREGKQREPDLMVLLDANDPRRQNRYWLGADLVVEVVSDDDPERDTVEKVADYAEAGIPEYWIINPLDETISVLTLAGDAYTPRIHRRGEEATSQLLGGFSLSVDAVFDAR